MRRLDPLLAAVALLAAAALTVLIAGLERRRAPADAAPAEAAPAGVAPDARQAALGLSQAFREVSRRLRPSVLNITTERWIRRADNPVMQLMEQFMDGGGAGRGVRMERSSGTGFVVRADGIAVTNDHVVAQAKRVLARLDDGTEVEARVVGTDPLSDVAVLRLEPRPDGAPYVPVELGDSDALDVGDWVIAVGNPFGLDQTVTAGIVSAKGRSRVGIAAYEDFIQTDAAINPGNSGGPLVSLDGRVVGVTTAIATRSGGYQGVGFAIPVAMTRDVIEDILVHGRVVRGWIGVSIQDASAELAERLGLGRRGGALISGVLPGGPAEQAGLRAGDLIVAAGGRPVEDSTRLRHQIGRAPQGRPIELGIVRDGAEHVVSVDVVERPSAEAPAARADDPEPPQGVGIRARELGPELAEAFGYERGAQGVVITGVEPGSAAAQAGVRPGMVLQEVDRRPVRTLDDLSAAVAAIDPARGVLLRVWDGDASTFVLVRAPFSGRPAAPAPR
ncbi:MAG: Do family serine endopeptidase [Planctomycetes bacterium]|nr:Do family serine endopeptidase [Planctomycetota bacterium]